MSYSKLSSAGAFKIILASAIIFFTAPSIRSQSLNIGLKFESLNYFYKNTVNGYSNESLMLLPFSGYLKSALSLGNYEVEIKAGMQLDELFAGSEGAISLKYNIGRGIYPLVIYMIHFNGGDARNLNGTYGTTFKFVGAGIEGKMTKVFGLDLIYYLPVGDRKLTYSLEYDRIEKTYKPSFTNITGMLKLGFIFNITII